jgi:hypothetical protein
MDERKTSPPSPTQLGSASAPPPQAAVPTTAANDHMLLTSAKTSGSKILKIGNFRLGKTIGVGSFGKVKSMQCTH